MMLLGIDPSIVTDDLDTQPFALGQLGFSSDGKIWIYLEADEAILASDVLVVHANGHASQLDTTTAAAGTGTGKRVAVAPESISQAIADGDSFWGCVYALSHETGGVDSAAAFVELYATATGGKIDDVFDGDQCVRGIVFHTALSGVTVEGAMINFPYVVNSIDS